MISVLEQRQITIAYFKQQLINSDHVMRLCPLTNPSTHFSREVKDNTEDIKGLYLIQTFNVRPFLMEYPAQCFLTEQESDLLDYAIVSRTLCPSLNSLSF